MSISGDRPQYNDYYIDGVNVNDEMGGGPGSVSGGTLSGWMPSRNFPY